MARKPWYRIEAQANSSAAEIYIYSVIGYYWDGTDAQSVADQIKGLDVDTITVRINSPGGDAFDGIAIANGLRAHKARVVVHVDGLAASAASLIAVAGDEVVMGPGSQMMIHDGSVYSAGTAEDLRADADRLDKLSVSMASLYARRAGGDEADWRDRMAAETWYTAEEAVASGLADRVAGDAVDPAAMAAFSLAQFRFAGRDHAPAPLIPPAAQAANRKEKPMASLIESLRERLGVAEDTTEEDALAALDEVLAEQAAPETPEVPADAAAAALAQIRASGQVIVDQAAFAQLQAQSQESAAKLAEYAAADRACEVQAHVDRGAITPAQKDGYLALLESAPEATRELLKTLASGAYPVAEVGYDAGVDQERDNTSAALTAAADKAGVGRLKL